MPEAGEPTRIRSSGEGGDDGIVGVVGGDGVVVEEEMDRCSRGWKEGIGTGGYLRTFAGGWKKCSGV